MAIGIGRRDFIALLAGTAIAWPRAVRAQQTGGTRRIGVILAIAETDPEVRPRIDKFEQELKSLGWDVGQNILIDYRFGRGDLSRERQQAEELAAMQPGVIVANGSPALTAAQQATRKIPIVFVQVVDPVGGGFVDSLARPGGNITGFSNYDYEIGGKWLEILKQIAPHLTRVAILRDPSVASGAGQLGAIQAVSSTFSFRLSPISVRNAAEIESGIGEFVREPNGGLVVLASGLAAVNRDLIITLAARHSLPAIYPYRYYAASGGLVSYGVDNNDLWRRAAIYVDRILHGEEPASLPVQAPTKFELVINLKTAKALGISVPASLLAVADEVIE